MKTARVLSLILLVIFYGVPLHVRAADAPLELISLPDAHAAETYLADMEAVLLEKYQLKIDTGTARPILQWAFVSGEMPPGLSLRTDGKIVGTPRVSASQTFEFRVKVFDAAQSSPEPLFLTVGLSIVVPQLRLVRVGAPRLTPATDSASRTPAKSRDADAAERASTEPVVRVGYDRADTGETARSSNNAAKWAAAAEDIRTTSCTGCDSNSCPLCNPQTSDDSRTITIDARTGLVKGERKYKKGQHAQVVIVHKNPYIRAYTTKIEETTVKETAIGTFIPLLSPFLADQITPTPKTDDTDNKAIAAANNREANCPSSTDIHDLIELKKDAEGQEVELVKNSNKLLKEHKPVAAAYTSGTEALSDPQASCNVLYCTSRNLRTQLEGRVSDASVKDVQDASDDMKSAAKALKRRAESLRNKFPDCDSTSLGDFSLIADGLLSKAAEVDAALEKVRGDNKKFDAAVETIKKALDTPNSFSEVYDIPQDRATDVVNVTLSAKSLKGFGGEVGDKSDDIAKVKVQFGDAPYFALSGGIAVSTLEKTEFQRVQGFATNRQGEVTGTELTSIIGVKEDSSTRITPILMLHGRLYRPASESFGFSGLHWSLGITAKNDNKGTDIEYLVGPSASFLNDQLFLTVGGYAGKKQTLDGNLFPGAEVPKDLADIPIHKNYHWRLGFALTYKLPVLK